MIVFSRSRALQIGRSLVELSCLGQAGNFSLVLDERFESFPGKDCSGWPSVKRLPALCPVWFCTARANVRFFWGEYI